MTSDPSSLSAPAYGASYAPSGRTRTGGPAWLTPRLTRWVALFLALLGLVAAVVIVVEATALRSRYDAVQAERADRVAAARVAGQFIVQYNTYSYNRLPAYKASVERMLSTKAKASFTDGVDKSTRLIQASKLTSKGDLLATGVASIDPDSAQVLVVADASARSTVQNSARHFRWQISMVKVDGHWLVDDFNAVS